MNANVFLYKVDLIQAPITNDGYLVSTTVKQFVKGREVGAGAACEVIVACCSCV